MNCLLTQILKILNMTFILLSLLFNIDHVNQKTLINGVNKLLPGHNIKITDGQIKIYRYLKFDLNCWLDKIEKFKVLKN